MKLFSCVATAVTIICICICILPWVIQSNTIDPRYHATTCLLEYSRSITFDYHHNCYVALFAYRPIKYNNIVKVVVEVEEAHIIRISSLLPLTIFVSVRSHERTQTVLIVSARDQCSSISITHSISYLINIDLISTLYLHSL